MDVNGRFSVRRLLVALPFSLGVTLLTGCWDNNTTKLQWMPDMADTGVVKAQRDYLDPPEGSVTMESMEYPKSAEDAETALTNPVASTPEVVAKGKVLFETFCIPCHGASGKGDDNTLHGLFPQPPNITHESYAKRKDGFFFYRISFGTALMPGYGHSITREERWIIVNYLRALQQKGA